MEEKTLFNISLICALIGILIILFISERKEISDSNISSISKNHLDKEVKVKGYVTTSTNLPGIFILDLQDNTGNITVVIFKEDENIDIKNGQVLEVTGIVKEYKNNLEVEASSVKIL